MKHQILVVACVVLAARATAQPAQPAGSAAPRIPLCPGLTIVTAVSQPQGDYESIKRIESVTTDGARIRYSSYMPDPTGDYDSTTVAPPPWLPFTVHRTVRRVDHDASASYMQIFDPNGKIPETVKGTTALGISRQSFRELRDKGKTTLSIFQAAGPSGINIDETGRPLSGVGEYRLPGELARVDPTPVMLPVLVNDRMTELPALRARGTFLWDDSEFFFLYDEANPISLKFRIGIPPPPSAEEQKLYEPLMKMMDDPAVRALVAKRQVARDVLQVVKITHKCEDPSLTLNAGGGGPAGGGGRGAAAGTGTGTGAGTGSGAGADASTGAAAIEESLAKSGRVDVYSIYFAFNSDEIREESEPTLQEIAEVLRRHPDWKLAIEGHTDNIATDAYNLQLSQRRSAAVKTALVSKRGVAGTRLTTAGFGESRPKGTNDTVEGRARNRRVELVKLP